MDMPILGVFAIWVAGVLAFLWYNKPSKGR